MRALVLALALTALVPGCGATRATTTAAAPMAAWAPDAAATKAARPDEPPMKALDCDGDGRVSKAELQAGFRLGDAAVTDAVFADYDLSRDGAWSRTEFARFLNHRAMGSWRLTGACS